MSPSCLSSHVRRVIQWMQKGLYLTKVKRDCRVNKAHFFALCVAPRMLIKLSMEIVPNAASKSKGKQHEFHLREHFEEPKHFPVSQANRGTGNGIPAPGGLFLSNGFSTQRSLKQSASFFVSLYQQREGPNPTLRAPCSCLKRGVPSRFLFFFGCCCCCCGKAEVTEMSILGICPCILSGKIWENSSKPLCWQRAVQLNLKRKAAFLILCATRMAMIFVVPDYELQCRLPLHTGGPWTIFKRSPSKNGTHMGVSK